jgi:hypothetical protein
VITDEPTTIRAQAFAKFVQGVSHGLIALVYDSGFVYNETDDPATLQLVGYNDVMTAALAQLDEAIALSATTFEIPDLWIQGVEMTNVQLAQVAHSYKARYRAEVARSVAERTAVDWAAVIADASAGVTSDFFSPVMDDVNWIWNTNAYGSFGGAWNQVNYFIHGMADQSGAYQTWMATTPTSRMPFLIITPDQRFPQGATLEVQNLDSNQYIVFSGPGGTKGHLRSERGTWRWSYYVDHRNKDYYADFLGPLPAMTVREMKLLMAEGRFRTNDAAGAATLINESRVAAGLNATNAAGLNTSCVPKLPNGNCGSLLEMLKWEKRMEVWNTHFGAWYMDSRGWGDLLEGTPIHWPVPGKELLVLAKPVYTFGGTGNPGSAPLGTYGY